MVVFLILIVVLFSVFVRHRLGFGFSLVFMPLGSFLLGFDGAFSVAILLETVIGFLMLIEYWAFVRVWDSLTLKIFASIGVVLGGLVKPLVSSSIVVISAMMLIILTCAYFWRREQRPLAHNLKNMFVCGLASGFLNVWTSLSGPPIVTYYSATETDSILIRGRLTGYFALLYPLTLVNLIWNGTYKSYPHWSTASVAVAATIFGYLGIRRLRMFRDFDLRKYSFSFIILVALVLLVREIINIQQQVGVPMYEG